jgi:hypothetical protein
MMDKKAVHLSSFWIYRPDKTEYEGAKATLTLVLKFHEWRFFPAHFYWNPQHDSRYFRERNDTTSERHRPVFHVLGLCIPV